MTETTAAPAVTPDPPGAAFAALVEEVAKLPTEARAQRWRDEASRIAETAEKHDRALSDGEMTRLLACEQRARSAEASAARVVEQRAALLSATPAATAHRQASPLAFRFTDDQLTDLRMAVTNYEKRAVTSSTALLSGPLYVADAVPFYREPNRIAEAMTMRTTDAPTVFYPRITGGATAAAMVAEGAVKPESTVTVSRFEAPFRKIAHWLQVTQEAMDDNAGLAALLRAEGLAGLVEKESQQLLTGTGTGQDLVGLVGATGTLTYAKAAGELRSVAIRNGMNTLRTTAAKLTAKQIILNPTTWTRIETEVGSDGQYLNRPNTQQAATPQLWGVPVLTSTHIGVDDALVADLTASSVLYVRQAPSVMVDPFTLATSNTIRIVIEERLSHALIEPRAVLRVTGLT